MIGKYLVGALIGLVVLVGSLRWLNTPTVQDAAPEPPDIESIEQTDFTAEANAEPEPALPTQAGSTPPPSQPNPPPDETVQPPAAAPPGQVAGVTREPVAPASYHLVVKVIDGDTISVEINRAVEVVRLIGVDAPETSGRRVENRCFGQESTAKAQQLLAQKRVRLESDPTQGDRDKYGRLLRYVFTEDDRNFNELMIRDGYAHEYTYNLPYKYQDLFKQAEQEAREASRGLWAQETCQGGARRQSRPVSPALPPGTDKDCRDFAAQADAQRFFKAAGGPTQDPHRLDNDGDGVACEGLP